MVKSLNQDSERESKNEYENNTAREREAARQARWAQDTSRAGAGPSGDTWSSKVSNERDALLRIHVARHITERVVDVIGSAAVVTSSVAPLPAIVGCSQYGRYLFRYSVRGSKVSVGLIRYIKCEHGMSASTGREQRDYSEEIESKVRQLGTSQHSEEIWRTVQRYKV